MTSARPRYFLPASLLILLVGFVLRVWGTAHNSLWIDEIWTSWYLRTPAGDFFHVLLNAQVPLFYVLQYLFPSNNDWMLRLPSLLYGLFGIALLIAVTYDLYRDADLALAAGVLLAANPYHILYSRMARPYALVFIEALLTSYFFLKLMRGQRTHAIWLGFLLASAAAYLTHYFALALPFAEYIFIGIYRSDSHKNRRFFWNWIAVQILAALPFAAWTLRRFISGQAGPGTGWIPDTTLQDIPLALASLGVGYDNMTLWYFIPALIALAVGLVFGAVYTLRRRGHPAECMWLLLIATTVLPPFLVSMVHPIFADRYLMVCLPAVLLLMLRGWTLLPGRVGTFGLVGVVALTGVIHVAQNIDSGTYTIQDWRAAAHYIAQQYQPGDTFVDDNPFALPCIEYYYPRPTDIQDHKIAITNETATDSLPSRLWFVYFDTRGNAQHAEESSRNSTRSNPTRSP